MTSADAIMNRVIDRMGSVPDCEVIQVCKEFNMTERIGTERFAAFYGALPQRQGKILHEMILHRDCPTCQQAYANAVAINADGSAHCRCPHCGREW
jgi:hypothetical protein